MFWDPLGRSRKQEFIISQKKPRLCGAHGDSAISREVASGYDTTEKATLLQLVGSICIARLAWHHSPSTWSNLSPSLEDHIIPSKHTQLQPFYKKAEDAR